MEASPIFSPGQKVVMQTPERTLTLTINRPFAPFTKTVVLVARSPQLGPNPVVVKIYDPRFLDERLMDTPHFAARPWSLELERAANALMDDPFELYEDDPEDAEGRAEDAAGQALRAVRACGHRRQTGSPLDSESNAAMLCVSVCDAPQAPANPRVHAKFDGTRTVSATT